MEEKNDGWQGQKEKYKEMIKEDLKKHTRIDENDNFVMEGVKDKIVLVRADEYKKLEKVIISYFGKDDLAKQILDIQPLYYDKNKIWWAWKMGEYKWEVVDETDILIFVNNLALINTIVSKEKNEIIEALKQQSRKRKPMSIKNTWIQFKDQIIDIEDGTTLQSTAKYFVTNPIPYSLNKDSFENTPVMDRIFTEWVGEENVKTLYEILAYCLLPDYPIHRIFCFIGGGMNGKSCFLNLLRKFIGNYNVCSTELDILLNSRFEVTRLHKKLVCQMGETNFNEMSKTSILKKLSGGDLIGFEYKRKDPFEEKNYAKIIISTNNLPTTSDKTIGFYRRWMIIDFPNMFSEEKDILNDIPEEEYECLALKCTTILHDLLKSRKFHREGSIEERIKKYEDHSNPLEKFMQEFVEEDFNGSIWKFEFEKKLNDWCKENKFRQLSEMVIGKKMKEKGIDQVHQMSDWFIERKKKQLRAWSGLKWKA